MDKIQGHDIALLGLVADHKRAIKDGSEYDKYFPASSGSYDIITKDGNVQRTVSEMDKLCRATQADTKGIAPLLKGKTFPETLKNVFNFYYTHVQYKLDKEGTEELRRPRRTWADRKTGVDCDCFSIAVASTLLNLGIDCKFRITKYSAGWQHVYVIVPLPQDSGRYYTIDCVLNSFNEEKTYSDKFDHTMKAKSTQPLSGIPIALLGSVADATFNVAQDKHDLLNGCHFKGVELEGLGTVSNNSPMLKAIYDHIVATRDIIRKEPESMVISGGAKNYLEMLDYAIAHWHTPQRSQALDVLEKQEQKWNAVKAKNGAVNGTDSAHEMEFEFSGADNDIIEGLAGLGKFSLKSIGESFFTNVKKAVNTVQTFNKNIVSKVKDKTKEAIAKAKELAQKAGALIKKFIILSNPLTLLMRAGFLLAMEVNLFQWAQRIYPAYFSLEEANKMGITQAAWNLSKKALTAAEDVFVGIGGSRTKLEKWIRKGRAHKKVHVAGLSGTDFLGEGISTAGSIIAAAGALATAGIKMAQSGMNNKAYARAQKEHDAEVTAQTKIKYQQARKANGLDEESLGGLGDDTVPSADGDSTSSTDATATDNGPSTASQNGTPDAPVEAPDMSEADASDKKGSKFKNFIAKIKAFFTRKKKKGEPIPTGQDIVADEQAAAANPATAADSVEETAKQKAKDAIANVLATGQSSDAALAAGKTAYINAGGGNLPSPYPSGNSGLMSKVKAFVVENPGKVAIGAVLVGGALALAFSEDARQMVGLSSKPKPKQKAVLSGLGKVAVYRKGHKVKKAKGMLPSGSKVKRVVLK